MNLGRMVIAFDSKNMISYVEAWQSSKTTIGAVKPYSISGQTITISGGEFTLKGDVLDLDGLTFNKLSGEEAKAGLMVLLNASK